MALTPKKTKEPIVNSSFRLTYAFSIISFIGIGLLALVLGLLYQWQAENTLIEHESQSSANLAQSFSNALLDEYADYFSEAEHLSSQEILQDPRFQRLRQAVSALVQGLGVHRILIYGRNGALIFSFDQRELGASHAENLGFRTAVRGEVFSRLSPKSHLPYASHREERYHRGLWARLAGWLTFSSIEDHYMASYVPIQRSALGPVQGVFEIYSDISALVAHKDRSGLQILVVIVVLMFLLYLFLLLFVRRADGLIQEHGQLKRHQQEERIRYLAHHDDLTGLPNRSLFTDALAGAIRQSRGDSPIAVLVVGVDRFRIINDSLGHEAGDLVLSEVARRIGRALSGRQKAFRVGGDEFAIVDEHSLAPEEAGRLAEAVLAAINQPLSIRGDEAFVSASIGIALYPADSDSPEALFIHAFSAVERAKHFGGGCHVFYTEDLNAPNRERLEMDLALRRALEEQQFELHYQPKADLTAGKVTGMEALLRWRHPQLGLVGPDRFIPILENTGLIVPVGAWVMQTACRRTRELQLADRSDLIVAVNVSLKQILSTASLIDTVLEALEQSGLPPASLELELTESILADNLEPVLETLHQLKGIGVRLSIDDFGTGYSSLAYLSHMPIDGLKIDKSFVQGMLERAENAHITDAIISLARSLKLGVTAEGVETTQQLATIRHLGCHLIQGYYFSRPVEPQLLAQRIQEIESRLDPAAIQTPDF